MAHGHRQSLPYMVGDATIHLAHGKGMSTDADCDDKWMDVQGFSMHEIMKLLGMGIRARCSVS